MDSVPWRIVALTRAHERERFASGSPPLDDFLRKYARQNADLDTGRTFVLVRGDETRVFGYYTLCAGAVAREHLPAEEARRLPRYPVPVAHLGRLARDQEVRGMGIESLLLADALRRACRVSKELALYAVDTLAKDEPARRFYGSTGSAGCSTIRCTSICRCGSSRSSSRGPEPPITSGARAP